MRLKEVTVSANTGLDAIKRAPIVEEETGLKCIRIQDISQGKDFDDWGNTVTTENDYKKFKLKINDLLVARTGATVGVSYLVKKDYNAVFNNGSIRLRLSKDVNTRFVYYVFKSKSFGQYIDNVSCVATQPNLRVENLLRFTIPDIGKEQQDEIVEILEKYDDLIENNTKRIKLLEQMAENLYKEWFVRFRFPGHEEVEFESGIPTTWTIKKLDEVLSLLDSQRKPMSSMERDGMAQNYPYYGAAGQLGYVEDYIFDGTYLLLGEDGSVITEDGYPYLQYVWGKFWVNNHAHIIEKNGKYSVEFLYCMFKKMNIQAIVTGVAQPKISQGRLMSRKVIIPDDATLKKFDELIQPIFSQIKKLTESNNNLIKQRDLLLPRLMSGKLEVK